MSENNITPTNEEIKTCAICGCTDEALFELEIDGEVKLVCADCAHDNDWEQCDDCGRWIQRDEMYLVDNGYPTERWVCEHCRHQYYICDACGEYFTSYYTHDDRYGNVVCDSCYHDRYTTCGNCGRITRLDDATWIDRENEYYCENCADGYRYDSEHFHDYSYKPDPEFHFTQEEGDRASAAHTSPLDSLLTFGVELEVDRGPDKDELCDDLANLRLPIYMKHDGSLGSEGVEIVTHPASLAYHAEGMGWKPIIRTCRDDGYRSHDTSTCGLHIHVGRRGMGPDGGSRDRTAGNLVILTNTLWNELVTFSRRKESSLDHWAARPKLATQINYGGYWNPDIRSLDLDDPGDLLDSALYTEHQGRYQAVNLCNAHTVEFRIFRGTLKYETLLACLQLVSNLTKYAMTHNPLECRKVKFADILSVQVFPELTEYCREKNLA